MKTNPKFISNFEEPKLNIQIGLFTQKELEKLFGQEVD